MPSMSSGRTIPLDEPLTAATGVAGVEVAEVGEAEEMEETEEIISTLVMVTAGWDGVMGEVRIGLVAMTGVGGARIGSETSLVGDLTSSVVGDRGVEEGFLPLTSALGEKVGAEKKSMLSLLVRVVSSGGTEVMGAPGAGAGAGGEPVVVICYLVRMGCDERMRECSMGRWKREEEKGDGQKMK